MVSYTSTWSAWNSDSSTTTTACYEDLWNGWVTSTADTTTATSGVWHTWVGTATATNSSTDVVWVSWNEAPQTYRTRERTAPTQVVTRTRSDREEKAKQSEERAKQLLLDLIGQEDLDVYNETGRLFVKGRKYDYIVQKHGFIQRVEKDKITDLCVHLDNRYKYPSTDNVVAMKLAIEADEDQILSLANNHGSCERPKVLPRAACM
jgi:hypothetical protein